MGAAAPWRMVLACLPAVSGLINAILSQGVRSKRTPKPVCPYYTLFYTILASQNTPTAPPGAHSFYCFSPQPLPSAAPPSDFSKNYFSIDLPVIFCQRSTFCTNRAHKLCVSSQGFFSFCIPSPFSGISELYKLGACFIIYFSFFAMFNFLLYLQNFPGIS